MRFVPYAGIGLLALAASAAGAASAVEPDAGLAFAVEPVAAPLALPASLLQWLPPAPAGPDQPVALEQLAEARGGSDSVSNDASLSGLVSGNAALHVNTGANIVDGAAFSNVAGIPIVIQNSGANVLIQNATIVNLQLK